MGSQIQRLMQHRSEYRNYKRCLLINNIDTAEYRFSLKDYYFINLEETIALVYELLFTSGYHLWLKNASPGSWENTL